MQINQNDQNNRNNDMFNDGMAVLGSERSLKNELNFGLTMPGNVAVTSATFDPKKYADELLSATPFCNHDGVLYIYKYTAPYATEFGMNYGGRYFPVTGVELNNLEMKIARGYMEVLASLKNVKNTVAVITDFIRVLANVIEIDESQNERWIIFCDGSYVDKADGFNFRLQSFGPDRFFSASLMITGPEFISVSSQPPSCIVELAQIEAGANWQNWLRCVLEAIGYLISGEPEKKIVVLQGVQDSFKSTVFNAVTSILPPGYVYTQTLGDLGDKFGLDSINDAKILSIADAESGTISPKSVSCLKRISGKDDIRINIKHKSGFSARVKAAIIVVTNHELPLHDVAAESRCACVPFPVSVVDPMLAADLASRFKIEAVQLFKAALVANMVRVNERRPLTGYAPLNSCTVESAPLMWKNLMWDFVAYAIVPDKTQNISKRQIFSAFVQACTIAGLTEMPDFEEFGRTFNSIFTAIRPMDAAKLTAVRVQGEANTLQGLKDYRICVEQFLNRLSGGF